MCYYIHSKEGIILSEQQKELDRLEENCYKIDKYFDTAEECLKYCEKRIVDLTEEASSLDNSANRFSDIINGYDDYYGALKDYITSKYDDYFTFVVLEIFVYLLSIAIIIQTPVMVAKIFFISIVIVVTSFNFWIVKEVNKIKEEIKKDVYERYNIDITSLSEEDIDDMEISLLQNKVRYVNINKEIEEYDFYIYWKKRKLERGY